MPSPPSPQGAQGSEKRPRTRQRQTPSSHRDRGRWGLAERVSEAVVALSSMAEQEVEATLRRYFSRTLLASSA